MTYRRFFVLFCSFCFIIILPGCIGCGNGWNTVTCEKARKLPEAAKDLKPVVLPASSGKSKNTPLLEVKYYKIPDRIAPRWFAYLKELSNDEIEQIRPLVNAVGAMEVYSSTRGLPEEVKNPPVNGNDRQVDDGLPKSFDYPPCALVYDYVDASSDLDRSSDKERWQRLRIGWPWIYGLDSEKVGTYHYFVEFHLESNVPLTGRETFIDCSGYSGKIHMVTKENHLKIVLLRHSRRGKNEPPGTSGIIGLRTDHTEFSALRFTLPKKIDWQEKKTLPWDTAPENTPSSHFLTQILSKELCQGHKSVFQPGPF
jgi:hypothetical protein